MVYSMSTVTFRDKTRSVTVKDRHTARTVKAKPTPVPEKN